MYPGVAHLTYAHRMDLGEGPGYDGNEDLFREALAREGGTPAKQQLRDEAADSCSGSLQNSPMIAAMPPGGGHGKSRDVEGIDALAGLRMIIIIDQ